MPLRHRKPNGARSAHLGCPISRDIRRNLRLAKVNSVKGVRLRFALKKKGIRCHVTYGSWSSPIVGFLSEPRNEANTEVSLRGSKRCDSNTLCSRPHQTPISVDDNSPSSLSLLTQFNTQPTKKSTKRTNPSLSQSLQLRYPPLLSLSLPIMQFENSKLEIIVNSNTSLTKVSMKPRKTFCQRNHKV